MFLQFELKHDETMFNTILGQRTKTYLSVTCWTVSFAFSMYFSIGIQYQAAAAISMEKCSARYVLSTMSIAKRENLGEKTPESESHFGGFCWNKAVRVFHNIFDSEMNEVGFLHLISSKPDLVVRFRSSASKLTPPETYMSPIVFQPYVWHIYPHLPIQNQRNISVGNEWQIYVYRSSFGYGEIHPVFQSKQRHHVEAWVQYLCCMLETHVIDGNKNGHEN